MSARVREIVSRDADQFGPNKLDDAINIMIVDGDPKNLAVLRSILDIPDYRIVSARSAVELHSALIADPFALMIFDASNSAMSRFELPEIIKDRKKTPGVPIIFLGDYPGDDQLILDADGAGAVDYLYKPVNPVILRSKVAVFAEIYRETRVAQRIARALLSEVDERRHAVEQLRELNETLVNTGNSRAAELQDSRVRFKRAADLAKLTYLSFDYSENLVEVAENFVAIMGFALPERFQGPNAIAEGCRLILERVSSKDRSQFVAAMELPRGEETRRLEYRVVGDDGKERWIESEWHWEVGADSRPTRAFVANLNVTERRQSTEHRKALMAEVNHRSKNLLSVIQAMVMQSARGADPRTFALQLSDRLQGLSASQDLLIKNDWSGIELHELVHAQLGHFEDLIGDRIHVHGPAVRLTAAGSQAMGMALRELCSNAARYGSLSNGEGRVRIFWEIHEEPEPTFSISWVEEGGPPVEPSIRNGFGHLVVGRIVEAALGGTARWILEETGASWQLIAFAKNALDLR